MVTTHRNPFPEPSRTLRTDALRPRLVKMALYVNEVLALCDKLETELGRVTDERDLLARKKGKIREAKRRLK